MKGFEMADSDEPEEMIKAGQRAIISMLKNTVAGMKAEFGEKIHGLTWEQVEYVLDLASKKEPVIIRQEREI